ncbi:MAG: diaminobutyrate--2-oxoglutarate transaminase, partial [Gammaproteobacteria bacterium]|nr:diaminobutyrate--2-oxoglutarate transaminase [Gammaproteobacteria bacterium]
MSTTTHQFDAIHRLESNVRGYSRSFPTVFNTALNAKLQDTSGREYIDFLAGAGTLNYGHNNPNVKQALIEHLQADGLMHGLDLASTAKIEFLETLDSVILKPRHLDYRVQFTGPTGANAVEAAIKLARKAKKRSHIISFTNAYHGHSLGALSLTGNQYYHDEHYGAHSNVSFMPFDNYFRDGADTAAQLRTLLNDGSSGIPLPAAIILETVQAEGGINVASNAWLQEIRRLCTDLDIVLIVDDIQTGNGRTGDFFSFEAANIIPDVVCISKSIGGGLPLSLLLIHSSLDIWQPGEHTGTFRGNQLAFVAGSTLLKLWLDDDFKSTLATNCAAAESQLQDIADQFEN